MNVRAGMKQSLADTLFACERAGWLIVLPVLVVALAGCGKKNTFVPPPVPEVTVQKPVQKDATVYYPFPGRTEAYESVDIRARVTGFLRSIEFTDGDKVEKDQVLFKIEPEQYQATLETAQAQLARAQASKKLADTTYDRKNLAYQTDAVSELDLLSAKAEQNSAVAGVQAAEAAVEQAELDLSYTDVKAPMAGTVGRHQVSVGNLVGGSQATLLTTLVVNDPLYVYFSMDERSTIPLLKMVREEHQDPPEVKLQLADGSTYPKTAKLDYADPTMDPDTGTLTVRAVVENPDGVLMPGMFTRVMIPKTAENAILVPDVAVQRDMVGSFVMTVDASNTVQSVYVTPGARVGDQRIIKKGLDADKQVIIKGLQRARPGVTVKPVPASASQDGAASKANADQKGSKE